MRCDVGGCGRPAVDMAPAPWTLAFCGKHESMLREAEAQHFVWDLEQTVSPDGHLVTEPPR